MSRMPPGPAAQQRRRLRSYCSFWLILLVLFGDSFWLLEHGVWRAPQVRAQAQTPAIKVETFDQDVGADGSTFTLTNDVGDTSSAFVRLNTGTRKTSAGPVGNTGNTAPDVGTVGLVLSGTNQVTVERANSTSVKVIGEVWRYEGVAGGGNEFITRDRVEATLTGTSVTVPVSGVGDVDRVIPVLTGYTVNDADVNAWNEATIAVHMTDTGDLEVSRNNSGTIAMVYVDIVEFTGENWTVCHGFSDAHDTAEQTITLNTSADGEGGATCDVTDWSTATVFQATMEGDSAETGLSDTLALVRPGTDTTSVVFGVQQDTGARNDGRAWIQVLQNDDLVVTRDANTNVTEGDNSFGTVAFPTGTSATTSLDELALEWFADTSGVGTAHMRGGLHARIAAPTSVLYADGDTVLAADYDSTVPGNFEAEITFAATPSGVIYEAGGTGTGSFVGYNDGGDFVIRAGNGASVAPADAARIVIPDTEYDFAGRTGTLTWQFDPDNESIELSFDEDSNGSVEYSTSTTAASAWANWSGGNDGGVGNSNANIAGSEITSGYDFNGSIASLQFTQGDSAISHWIHRSGNDVGIEYGVIDLSHLEAVTSPTYAEIIGDQIATTSVAVTDVFMGQQLAVIELSAAQNITNIVVSESGTIDAATGLSNVRLRYELDTTAPYDCLDESYDGTEVQYGATTTFSGADGTAVFSDSVSISPTAAFCAYVETDVTASAQNGETINISIDDATTDITVTGATTVSGSALGATSFTTVTDPELTQTGYHWRDDDGGETAATSATGGVENTPGLAFAAGTAQRLRLGVAALGSSSVSAQYRLEYAEKVTTCSAATTWVSVGDVGGAWDMFDSTFVFEGDDTTNIAVSSGGVSDGGTAFVSPNGGVRDVTDATGSITLDADAGEFVELEYAVEATGSALEGVGYCFRVTDAGTPLRAYNSYPEATLNADVTIGATGAHVATVAAGATIEYMGGQFTAISNSGNHTLTEVVITETGSIDASTYLSNPRLYYESDTTNPRDCASESYDGTESFAVGTDFVSSNGSSTFTLSSPVRTNESFCAYVVVDVSSTSTDGQTIAFEITNPNTDVTIAGATVGPGTAVSPSGQVTVEAPSLTQTGYHWRNDDGDEAGATSATGGTDNTVIGPVFQGSTQRLRLQVANDGSQSGTGVGLRLEYGTKVTTCENIGVWQRVDSGVAFAMDTTSQLIDGSDTTNVSVGDGGVTDPAGAFLTPNGGQADSVDQLADLTLTTTDFVEVEYALELTDASAFGATYCFRVTDAGVPLSTYTTYAELTVQDRQDFFVQRDTTRVTGTSQTLTAGIDYTAPASSTAAFVRITNTTMTGAGSDTFGAQRQADDFFAYIAGSVDLTSSFTIERPSTASDDTFVAWEIVEYVGVAGGDNEFVVRDADALLYGGTDLYATGTAVTGVVDDTDVAVIITGQLNPSTGSNDFNIAMSVSSWDSTGDQPVFERGDADSLAAGVSYAVVEFTGASWQVQRVEHTYTAAGVTETSPITAVNSLTRTFLHTQKLMGDELYNLDEGGHTVWLSSIGAVSFELQSGATSPEQHRSVAWVIENTQQGDGAMQVYRTNGTIANGGAEPAIFQLSIGGTVNVTSASIWANSRSTGAGNFHPRVILGASILNESQYEFWRSDNGQTQTYRTEVVDWPVAETSVRQTHYRLYVDNDTLTPTDPWPAGGSDLGENSAMTDLDEPLGEGERVRVRTGLFVNNASLIADSATFKLQYGRRISTCSAVSSWSDLDDPGGGGIWRGFDATPVDATTLPSGLLSVTNQLGTYEEDNPSAANPSTVSIGEYVEYDWQVEHNGALQKSSYCFRMVYSDGSEIDGYDVYPTIRTTGYTPVIVNWRWYDDETSLTPGTPLSGEGVAPVDIAASNTLKLRIAVTEVEGAPGENIKFNLQYSQWSDFRDGGTTLTATSSCVGLTRTWCYADGAGINNDIIDSTVLSGVDSCVSGTGDGCGTVNEAEGLIGTYDQPVFTTSEHEFTLLHNSVGFDQVFYFRMVDATNGVPLVASTSYPSLTTEGAALTFTVSGLAGDQVIEGVTLDATTTATEIAFGSLPFGSSIEAGQRLTVYTNGTEGYRVYLQADQQLQNTYGEALAPVTGTNASPQPWATGCSGSAVSCFGYHAGDNILYDGDLRFALDDTYAGLSASPVEVMASGVPVTFDMSDIVYRTEVTELQPAGDYTTTLRYIVVPVF